jgi:hypothetical protein
MSASASSASSKPKRDWCSTCGRDGKWPVCPCCKKKRVCKNCVDGPIEFKHWLVVHPECDVCHEKGLCEDCIRVCYDCHNTGENFDTKVYCADCVPITFRNTCNDHYWWTCGNKAHAEERDEDDYECGDCQSNKNYAGKMGEW